MGASKCLSTQIRLELCYNELWKITKHVKFPERNKILSLYKKELYVKTKLLFIIILTIPCKQLCPTPMLYRMPLRTHAQKAYVKKLTYFYRYHMFLRRKWGK